MEGFAQSFEQPDDTTRFPNGQERVVQVRGVPVGLATFEPGWRWSNDLRPMFGTDLCPVRHVGYLLSGRLHAEVDGGPTLDIESGQVFEIPPGHDAWVVGDEACVMLDWGGKVREYAQSTDQSIGGTR